MTSLFEHYPVYSSGYAAELPVDLITCDSRGVTLLEFQPVQSAAVAPAEAEPGEEQDFKADERSVQMGVMIAAAREEAAAATTLQFERQLQEQEQAERGRSLALRQAFADDRQKYFHHAEAQIVQLAIAIARRILCREIEADALVLRSAVRAALARVQEESRSTLRICSAECAAWQPLFADQDSVTVVADTRLEPGECVLETSIGRVELGLETQLLEVQRSFDGLLFAQGAA